MLWTAGAFGAASVVAASPDHNLVLATFEKPELLLASGWVFVALTGLFFKEWACFQRTEASAGFALVPIVTGGHFLGILPPLAEVALSCEKSTLPPHKLMPQLRVTSRARVSCASSMGGTLCVFTSTPYAWLHENATVCVSVAPLEMGTLRSV